MNSPPPPPLPVVIIVLVLLGTVEAGCQLQCSAKYVEDCEHCHTVHVKQCDILMKKVMVPVKVRKCSPLSQTSLDGVSCVDGARTRCKVRFETECSRRVEYQVIEEDYPDCRTENVLSCRDPTESNLVGPRCRQVGVRRCQIVKRRVRKARPRHQCRRVPRKECARLPCKLESKEECRVSLSLQLRHKPEETCRLQPSRVCQQGECRRKLRRDCHCQDMSTSTSTPSTSTPSTLP